MLFPDNSKDPVPDFVKAVPVPAMVPDIVDVFPTFTVIAPPLVERLPSVTPPLVDVKFKAPPAV